MLVIAPVFAQDSETILNLNPDQINIVGLKKTDAPPALSRTVELIASRPIAEVRINSSELQNADPLTATQAFIDPTVVQIVPNILNNLEADEPEEIQISITGVTVPGEWSGSINLRWREVAGGDVQEQTFPLTISVQTTPELVLDQPAAITMRGQHKLLGFVDIGTVERRSISVTLDNEGTAATDLKFNFSELLTEDHGRAFFTDFMTAAFLNNDGQQINTLRAGERGNVQITLDLGSAASGQYTGNIFLQSANARELPIPITVEVKDPPYLPFLVLLLGSFVSFTISIYRTRLQPADTLRAKINKARKNSATTDRFFQSHLSPEYNRLLDEATLEVESFRLPEANEKISKAQNILIKWQANTRNVIERAVKQITDLSQHLDESADRDKHLFRLLRNEISVELVKIPNYLDTPADLEKRLNDWKYIREHLITIYGHLSTIEGYLLNLNEDKEHFIDASELETLKPYTTLDNLKQQIEDALALPTPTVIAETESAFRQLENSIYKALESGKKIQAEWEDHLRKIVTIQQKSYDAALHSRLVIVKPLFDKIDTLTTETAKSIRASKHWAEGVQQTQNLEYASNTLRWLLTADGQRNSQTEAEWLPVETTQQNLAETLMDVINDPKRDNRDFRGSLSDAIEALQQAVKAVTGNYFHEPDRHEEMQQILMMQAHSVSPMFADQSFGAAGQVEFAPAYDHYELNEAAEVYHEAMERTVRRDRLLKPIRAMIDGIAGWFSQPDKRILTSEVVSFAIVLILFTSFGFQELYAKVTTFGVNGLADYIGLFAAGFGVDATRSQILGLAQQWDTFPKGPG